MFLKHLHFLDRSFLCSADKDEEALGPGGVSTPTPEPGPTPTPQPEPEVKVGDETKGALKPITELLGKKDEKGGEVEPPVKSDPVAARINALTAEKWELKRAKDAADARAKLAEDTIAELQKLGAEAPKDGETPPAKPTPRTFTAAEVEAEANRLAAQNLFHSEVDKAVIAGRAAHEDYNEAIDGLKKITGPVVPAEFLAAALETGEASEIIYHLGKNAAEADRILSLPMIKQAVALQKLASELADARPIPGEEGPKVSKAPKPIQPRVGGRGSAEPNLETMPMKDFIALRNKQEREYNQTRH
jgi:hypothetical protein